MHVYTTCSGMYMHVYIDGLLTGVGYASQYILCDSMFYNEQVLGINYASVKALERLCVCQFMRKSV